MPLILFERFIFSNRLAHPPGSLQDVLNKRHPPRTTLSPFPSVCGVAATAALSDLHKGRQEVHRGNEPLDIVTSLRRLSRVHLVEMLLEALLALQGLYAVRCLGGKQCPTVACVLDALLRFSQYSGDFCKWHTGKAGFLNKSSLVNARLRQPLH